DAGGVLQLRGNRLAQVLIADDVLQALLKAVNDGRGKVDGVFRAAFVENNLLEMDEYEFVAVNLTLTGNTFAPLPLTGEGLVLGYAVANGAVFASNLGPVRGGACFFRYAAIDAVNQKAATYTVLGPGNPPPQITIQVPGGNTGIRFEG